MKSPGELCSNCSTSLFSSTGNQRRQKLLETPCQHVFHRNCLKTRFRRNPPENSCPKCTRPVSWNEVKVWQESQKTTKSHKKNLESEEVGLPVPSLKEEIRQKKAEELVKTRCARKLNKALLEEYKQREILQQQKLSALRQQRAEICNKKSSGENKRQRIQFLKNICFGVLCFLLAYSFGFGSFIIASTIFYSLDGSMETTSTLCIAKLDEIVELNKVYKSTLAEYKEKRKVKNPDEDLYAKMRADLEKAARILDKVNTIHAEVRRGCIPKMQEKAEEIQQDFTITMGSNTGNGWSRRWLYSKEIKLKEEVMQKSFMERYALEEDAFQFKV